MIPAARILVSILLGIVCTTHVFLIEIRPGPNPHHTGAKKIAPITRVQKRLLHELAQQAELNLEQVLTDELPTPEKSDSFHPATKSLGS